ncbi:MAG: heavy metal-associated domain-containing protein [Bacteroidota bacterium]
MKRILILVIALGTLSLLAYGQSSQKAPSTKDTVKLEKAAINVETAVCDMCSATIETAAEKAEGVKSATVDLETKIAAVEFDPSRTTLAKIEQAIANAGYNANETVRDAEAYKKLDACCKLDPKKKK